MDVLLVAADGSIRDRFAAALALRGHAVTTLAPEQATAEAFADRRVDLAVLDWSAPGPAGLELCRRLRAAPQGEETHVLVLTARDQPDDVAMLLAAGADDYLVDHLDFQQLDARLHVAERYVAAKAARAAAEAERARLDAEVARAGERLRTLFAATVEAHVALSEERVVEVLGSAVVGVGLNAHIAMAVADAPPEELALEIRYAALTDRLLPAVERLMGRPIAGIRLDGAKVEPYPTVLTENRVVSVDDAAAWLRRALPWLDKRAFRAIARLRGVGQGACAPITDGQRVLGVLSVWGSSLTDADLPTLGLLGYQAGTAIMSLRRRRSDAERAQLDGAVKTARAVAHELGTQLALVAAYGEQLVGQLRGDQAVSAAEIVQAAIAAGGTIGRLQQITRFLETDAGGGPMLDIAAAIERPGVPSAAQ